MLLLSNDFVMRPIEKRIGVSSSIDYHWTLVSPHKTFEGCAGSKGVWRIWKLEGGGSVGGSKGEKPMKKTTEERRGLLRSQSQNFFEKNFFLFFVLLPNVYFFIRGSSPLRFLYTPLWWLGYACMIRVCLCAMQIETVFSLHLSSRGRLSRL